MDVSIILPFRGQDEDRIRACRYVYNRYKRLHPDWELCLGSCRGPKWNKGKAVRDAVEKSSGDILVISDADVVMADDVLPRAVDALQVGPWVVPHGMVYRLGKKASEELYAGGPCPDPTWSSQLCEPLRRHTPGGGICVIPRETYERVPIDERFEQWGGEDMAWGWALEALVGQARFLNRPMWHLYHQRAYVTPDNRGSVETEALLARYLDASGNPDAIREVMTT